MPYVFGEGGSVLIEGDKYDLRKVVGAATRVIQVFTNVFGCGRSTFRPNQPKRITFVWPAEAAAMRRFWSNVAKLYDACDEPLLHEFGGLTLKAFLTGETWCVYHQEMDLLTTTDGEPVSRLNPAPMISICGPEIERNSYELLPFKTVSLVEALFKGELAGLRLKFEKSGIVALPEDPSKRFQFANVVFPHPVYGLGRDWMRVRCVRADGSEVGTVTPKS